MVPDNPNIPIPPPRPATKREIVREYAKARLSGAGWTNVFDEEKYVSRIFDEAELMYAEEEKRYGGKNE
jgi:hypothetical protein